MRRQFFTLDVFTDRRFAGNPLAVVIEAQGLDTQTMQTVAREFNHPETVFVLPPDDPKHRAKLRIFTPATELPFAGHPTVGTAVLLARLDGGKDAREFVLEEKIGLVPCHAHPQSADTGFTRFRLPSLPALAGELPGTQELAAALSLQAADIGGSHKPARWSAGVPFCCVPLRGLDAMSRARPDPAHFERVFAIGGPGKVFLFCEECVDKDNTFHARMFAPAMGIPEDPATGAACAAFAGLVAARGSLADGEHHVRIEQGVEMGRPSLIELGLTIRDGALAAATIGGSAVVVTEGKIEA